MSKADKNVLTGLVVAFLTGFANHVGGHVADRWLGTKICPCNNGR